MNGVHDLGGMHGFGPVLTEENEPVFHHDWERRIFPLFASLFVGGHFNVDEFRHSIERMEPAEYLQSSYYEHWLHAFETLLLEKGVISAAELQGTVKPSSPAQPPTVLTPDIVEAVILGGASSRAKEPVGGRFRVGDRVRTKNLNPTTHTRLPRYARQGRDHRDCTRRVCHPRHDGPRSRRTTPTGLCRSLQCYRTVGSGATGQCLH